MIDWSEPGLEMTEHEWSRARDEDGVTERDLYEKIALGKLTVDRLFEREITRRTPGASEH